MFFGPIRAVEDDVSQSTNLSVVWAWWGDAYWIVVSRSEFASKARYRCCCRARYFGRGEREPEGLVVSFCSGPFLVKYASRLGASPINGGSSPFAVLFQG